MRWTSAAGLSLLVLGIWTSDVGAFGCQASGSLPIFPSDGTPCSAALQPGDTADVAITVTNTSSSDRKSTRLNSSHVTTSRMPSSA